MKTTLSILLWFCVSLASAETLDLSGRWNFQLDPQDKGTASNVEETFTDSISLPGTVSQAHIGNPLSVQPLLPVPAPENLNLKRGLTFGRDKTVLETSPLAHLYQRFSYVGPAWYRRSFDVPKNWADKDVQLVLERVMWQSRVWVNGQPLGSRNSLTTPHRYEIGDILKPGRNEIVIRIDNRRQLEIGNPHAYTDESQTIWNGIIGRVALEAREKVRIDHLELRPDLDRKGVEVMVKIHNGTGKETATQLSLIASADNFKAGRLPPMQSSTTLPPGNSELKVFYPLGTNVELWSEFNPKLYRLQASLTYDNHRSQASSDFGMREFKADGQGFTINGQPVFLRGSVNCCEFPKTGYPDMTGAQWEKIFSTVKAYGLNHVRFHTWCPPEVAFEIADRLGIYLEVELPNWCFKLGQDTNVTAFFYAEGERMIREYGNHPSWVMLTMGNELKGDYTILDGLEAHFRKLDPQLLYDSTTYPSVRGKVPGPVDDYYISQDTKMGRARGQDIFEITRPNTETNFAEAISPINVPFISHEVGQYCVYPNLDEIPKYNGVLRAVGFEAVRNDLPKKGRLEEAGTYTRDSGELAVVLYKEEIERALRTPNQAGLQLLQLNDFPGQGTSTVGLLDAFWGSKHLIMPGEFRNFCAPVVPLLLMPKRVYQNSETFDAGIQIANFGSQPITNATITWKISSGRKRIAAGLLHVPLISLGHGQELGRIQQSLSNVTSAAKLNVTVEIPGTAAKNDWFVWVYPATEPAGPANDIAIFQSPTKSFYQALQDGKRVLLLPSRESVAAPLAAQFTPVFWNPVMFPNQPGSMGAMIDANHPAFSEFPTDPWTNWQWWELLHTSFAINLDTLPEKISMPLRFVDKFDRNALPAAIFEAKVGKGRLLVCTLDISHDLDTRIAARQLYRSLIHYMTGDHGDLFLPQASLSIADLESLFHTTP